MNKQELITTVADRTGLNRNDAVKAVEEVRLVGFGTFASSQRKASTGRNPRTGEPLEIGASVQPKFKAGKGLKDACNG